MIECDKCGQILEIDNTGTSFHICPVEISYHGNTSDDGRSDANYELKENKHSVIVDGVEYFVDANKLAILEKLIQL